MAVTSAPFPVPHPLGPEKVTEYRFQSEAAVGLWV